MEKTTKTQRVIAIVLTALFIPMIAAGGVYGAITNGGEIGKSIRYSRAQSYLTNKDDPAFLK